METQKFLYFRYFDSIKQFILTVDLGVLKMIRTKYFGTIFLLNVFHLLCLQI